MKSRNHASLMGIFEFLAVALLLSGAAPASRAQLQFSGPVNFAVGSSPSTVVTGDFNGDGKLDQAVLNTGDHTVSILLGNGDGTFQPAISNPVGSNAQFIAVGDFNGDGKLDLVVANGAANTVSVMLGNGDGTFQTAVQYNIGSSADFVAVADFNNDEKLDLLVSTSGGEGPNEVAGSIAILLGNGDGTFQAAKTTSTGSFTGTTPFVAVGDFNGDGKFDVATGNGFAKPNCDSHEGNCVDGNVIVFLGKGDGTFQSPVTSVVNFGVDQLVAADFNGDGKTDLALIGGEAIPNGIGGSTPVRQIATVLGKGDGTFNASTFLAYLSSGSCSGVTNVAVADLNGDAKLDLIAAVGVSPNCTGSSNVMTFLGNGDGTFQPAQSFNLATVPGWLAVGDFSADALPDIVLSNPSADSVSVFLNTAPSVTLSLTLAGNGGGTVASQSEVLNCSKSCSGEFAPGTTVTLTATPNRTSEFSGWGGACSGAIATCMVNMSANQAVTATFTAAPLSLLSVSLAGNGGGSVTSSPTGINCGSACSSSFITGTTVALTATPNATSNFTGWSGACSGTGACNVTLNAAASVTATFTPQDFSLTPASTSLMLQPGGQQTDVITIAGINGPFASTIQLTCAVTGPAPEPSCGLLQTSVMPGANSVTSTLTITAPMVAAMRLPFNRPQSGGFVFASWLPLALLGIALVGVRKKATSRQWALCGFLTLLFMMQAACGGGSSPPPPSFIVTVTGASGATQHTAQVTVTLQ